MSNTPPGRIVDFSATLRPSAKMKLIEHAYGADSDEVSRPALGGIMILRIHDMSIEERLAVVADAVRTNDLLVVYWAMLSPKERRDILAAAEKTLRADLARECDVAGVGDLSAIPKR